MDETVPAQLAGEPEPSAPALPPTEQDTARAEQAEQAEQADSAPSPSPSPSPVARRPAWHVLARPRTLVLVSAPIIVTLALLLAHRAPIVLPAAALTLLAAMLTQAGANVLDAYLETERARHSSWLAGTVDDDRHARVLGLRPLAVLRVSIALIVLGGCAGVPLIHYGGWPVATLGALGLGVAFLYSATTYALKRMPGGELPIFLALGPGLTLATVLIQRQRPALDVVLVGCALGLLATAVLELARLRNIALGRVAGGARRILAGRWLTALCIVGAYGSVLVSALASAPARGAILAFLSLPTALVALTGTLMVRSTAVAQLAARATLRVYIVFAVLLLAGIVLPLVLLRLWQSF